MSWSVVVSKGGRKSSLALAAATRVPANINIWNKRTDFIVSLDLPHSFDAVSALACFATSLKSPGTVHSSFQNRRCPHRPLPASDFSKLEIQGKLNLACTRSGYGVDQIGVSRIPLQRRNVSLRRMGST
jgi:hypothetical protein